MAEKMAGVSGPFGFFDPMGLTPESNEELQLFREAELAHGRVAMVGALGFLVQEHFHPIFADVGGPRDPPAGHHPADAERAERGDGDALRHLLQRVVARAHRLDGA